MIVSAAPSLRMVTCFTLPRRRHRTGMRVACNRLTPRKPPRRHVPGPTSVTKTINNAAFSSLRTMQLCPKAYRYFEPSGSNTIIVACWVCLRSSRLLYHTQQGVLQNGYHPSPQSTICNRQHLQVSSNHGSLMGSGHHPADCKDCQRTVVKVKNSWALSTPCTTHV